MSSMRAPFFAFRTALLPFEAFGAWAEGWAPATGEQAWSASLQPLRDRLRTWVEKPHIREALFLASPDLEAALPHWMQDPDSEKGRRAEISLVRYFARMCGRSTPFGLFAGCSLGRVGEATRLVVSPSDDYLRHTRLDMDYLFALTETMAQDREFRDRLKYRPNSSLYRAGGRLRYVEARMRGKVRTYHLVAVDETDYLQATLERAKGGATLAALASALIEDDLSFEETRAYLDELADAQVLVPEWAPPVTGPEPIHALLEGLATHPEGAKLSQALTAVRDQLQALDDAGMGSAPDAYRSIAGTLESLPVKVEINRLFQVDLVKPAPEATLGDDVTKELLSAIAMLTRISPNGKSSMSEFAEAFERRYEGRQVPLVEALDDEIGVSFQAVGESSPLMDGIYFPGRAGESKVNWTVKEAHMAESLQRCAAEGKKVWVLTEADVKAMETTKPLPLPSTMAAMAKVVAASEAELAEGRFEVVFQSASGPSGANLLGRFCHGDPALTEAVRGLLREEEARAPEAIHAEIVHLPEGRIGNVILRPLLREYEIPFLGRSGAPEDRQILVDDLRVSVRGGRVILTSARLGKEVRPRLTNAHNYSARSLGMYRFLAMLQHQGVTPGVGWYWGPFESQSFLPRVMWKRTILSPAKWRVKKAELDAAVKAVGAERWALLQAWRASRDLPRFFLLADGDNHLPVDMDNALSLDAFLDVVKGRGSFELEEMVPSPESLIAQGPEGRFVHELVVPFVAEAMEPERALAIPKRPPTVRTFAPGSEWLYVKLYAGAAACDQLLRELVHPLIAEIKAAGDADGWFFLRYEDPDKHLRLRFHGEGSRMLATIAPRIYALAQPFFDNRLLWKIQFDTYEREVERYGSGEGIALAEKVFCADSDAVLDLMAAYGGDAFADLRWRFCLLGADRLMTDMGFSLEEKHHLASGMAEGFAEEHGLKGDLLKPISDRFRKERASLQALLEADGRMEGMEAAHAAFAKRSALLMPLAEQLRACVGQPGIPSLMELTESYIHMHSTRMFRSAQRAQEALIYEFLSKLYDSRLARARKEKPVSV